MTDLHGEPVIRLSAAARIREFEASFATPGTLYAGSAVRAHRELAALLDHELGLFAGPGVA